MIRISLRSRLATNNATEWVSVCILIGLALISLTAAFEHLRVGARSLATPTQAAARRAPAGFPEQPHRQPVPKALPADTAPPATPIPPQPVLYEAPTPAPAVVASTPSTRAAERVPARVDPGQTTETSTKTPELPRMARIVSPARDMDNGDADRSVPGVTSVPAPAAGTTASVVARQRDLPLLREEQAFETWGGEFAKGDTRLKEMIQAGALTSVQRGAKVRILEVRGALAHVEIVGQGRRGWIRSSCLGR
ncbi:MAG: hypothetical protein ABSF98_27910 [Bryobacteraceae bacterium]